MSDFLILNWGMRLTRTEQLIDCGLITHLILPKLNQTKKIIYCDTNTKVKLATVALYIQLR